MEGYMGYPNAPAASSGLSPCCSIQWKPCVYDVWSVAQRKILNTSADAREQGSILCLAVGSTLDPDKVIVTLMRSRGMHGIWIRAEKIGRLEMGCRSDDLEPAE